MQSSVRSPPYLISLLCLYPPLVRPMQNMHACNYCSTPTLFLFTFTFLLVYGLCVVIVFEYTLLYVCTYLKIVSCCYVFAPNRIVLYWICSIVLCPV
ncbi:hypothetical protein BDV95DRAFT_583198 [Massariosphaeria phaeospora]|uniref:Uncharacterized protein n=1 Tax=Massariosphaeria phaeospora TaxID=100035 RepID=A0A7C8M1B1_9PLEO|nr:hypothetical protein BDV95DRAFT_583198 [Massariosphaeria phaeospora]